MRTFEVKQEHLKLLRNAIIRWEDCEFGAPAIDCKRPYGNSQVLSDIAEILGIKPAKVNPFDKDEFGFSEEQEDMMNQLHRETVTVLQIAVSTGKFEVGIYEADDYENDWKLVKK